ncbi:hypothetical protein TNCV_2927191 [Trichonephila clavipes]|nr:hypothetical protein TNCV_2927191 [Trichonephila clavipes]
MDKLALASLCGRGSTVTLGLELLHADYESADITTRLPQPLVDAKYNNTRAIGDETRYSELRSSKGDDIPESVQHLFELSHHDNGRMGGFLVASGLELATRQHKPGVHDPVHRATAALG